MAAESGTSPHLRTASDLPLLALVDRAESPSEEDLVAANKDETTAKTIRKGGRSGGAAGSFPGWSAAGRSTVTRLMLDSPCIGGISSCAFTSEVTNGGDEPDLNRGLGLRLARRWRRLRVWRFFLELARQRQRRQGRADDRSDGGMHEPRTEEVDLVLS